MAIEMSEQAVDLEQIAREEAFVRDLVGADDATPIERVEIGWTSRVYLVKQGEYVVKFPRFENVKQEYTREIALLRQLEACDLPVDVPRILWTSPEQAYMGYAGVVGTSFDQLAPDSSVESRLALGAKLGEFFKQLHAMQPAGAVTMTLEEEIAEMQYKYGLGAKVFARDFSAAERQQLDALVHDILPAALREAGADYAFCHGDLGYWNMVVGEGGALGIIDFGDSGYYDRAKDFAALEDADLRDEALRVYGADDALRQRIAIRRRVLPIVDLPFYVGKQDEEGIAAKVRQIRAIL